MLEEQLKNINELSFQANKTKDEKEKEQLENNVKSIIFDLKVLNLRVTLKSF